MMYCCVASCVMSLHCILDSFIASLQCRPSCINAICRMMHCYIVSCIMSLHYILDPFIASLQCRLSCNNAICRMMHCCIVSCIMSLHCIHACNNRVLGHCSGKVSRIPCFQAVETSCLKIFIIICLLLSPSDPIDRSYSLPAYAGSFGVVNTSAGDILLERHFRTLLT